MKDASKYRFCDALIDSLDSWDCPTRNSKRYAAVEHLKQKWGIKEATEVFVWDISSFFKIESCVFLGFDPRQISRAYILNRPKYCIGWKEEDEEEFLVGFHCWTKSAVERVAELGFPIDCDCVPVVDDEFCEW